MTLEVDTAFCLQGPEAGYTLPLDCLSLILGRKSWSGRSRLLMYPLKQILKGRMLHLQFSSLMSADRNEYRFLMACSNKICLKLQAS